MADAGSFVYRFFARRFVANRLIDSTSPYLLQHAHNPVDWYPWGAEALERARQEDKPIFLSIGYAACHWCHVMEHEVFENAQIAALMNEHFVNIKVDREERPDLDELYMLATQLMTGQGGWPMSVWLTPGLEPFYAGTYFPPVDGYGRPGFPRLELALVEAWKKRRGDLEEQARKVVEAIRMHADESARGLEDRSQKSEDLVGGWLRVATEQFADRFDEVNGGFGGAPKFPPHQALGLWVGQLNAEAAAGGLSGAEQRILAHKVQLTLDAMADGGIYDQVGGAFARYSTDERWLVPHFEKMLYDSAQLAPVYAGASILLEKPEYGRVARETLDFFLREMMSEEGAFYSSLDADSEGVEGKYYVWTIGDLRAALGDEADVALMVEHYGLKETGNWHETPVEGGSVLAVAVPVEALAEKHRTTAGAMRERVDGLRERMRVYRERRPRPGLDDKILTSWNGLMLSALAVTGRLLGERRYVGAAGRLAEFLFSRHMVAGTDGVRLMRVSRGGGVAHTEGFLDDYAFLLNGVLDLWEATAAGASRDALREQARGLAEALLGQFEDEAHGGFFYTGPRHEKLFARMKNAADNATPSANGVAIRGLLRLARVTGEERYRAAALRAVGAFATNIERRPEYFPTILRALLEDGAAAGGKSGEMRADVGGGAPERGGRLQVAVESVGRVAAGVPFEVRVRLTVAAGFHVQGHVGGDPAVAKTVVRVRPLERVEAISQEWRYPPAGAGGYEGSVTLVGLCTLPAGTGAGALRCRAIVEGQVCSDEACFAPEQVTAEFLLEVAG